MVSTHDVITSSASRQNNNAGLFGFVFASVGEYSATGRCHFLWQSMGISTGCVCHGGLRKLSIPCVWEESYIASCGMASLTAARICLSPAMTSSKGILSAVPTWLYDESLFSLLECLAPIIPSFSYNASDNQ